MAAHEIPAATDTTRLDAGIVLFFSPFRSAMLGVVRVMFPRCGCKVFQRLGAVHVKVPVPSDVSTLGA